MWELDHKKCWAPKNWCFPTVVLEKTLKSPLDSKEIKPVNAKGNQPWLIIERTDAEAEAPVLRPPDVKSRLFGKDPDAGKDWGKEEKGVTEDEMVGWHHQQNGHESGRTPGNSEGRGSLACCSPWSRKELDVTEQLHGFVWWLCLCPALPSDSYLAPQELFMFKRIPPASNTWVSVTAFLLSMSGEHSVHRVFQVYYIFLIFDSFS